MRNHYYFSINDLASAHGSDPQLAWDGANPADLAAAVREALRTPALFERWRAAQPEPDEVDTSLAVTDDSAEVRAAVADLHVDLELITTLPMRVVRQRLNLLIGPHWQLRDMRAA
jgi:hypothetical protein